MISLPDFRVVLRTPVVDDFWMNHGIGKTSSTLSGQQYLEFLRKEYPSFRLRAPSVYNTHHNWQEVNRFFDIARVPRNGFYVGDVHKDASRLKCVNTFRRVIATLHLHRLKETEAKKEDECVQPPPAPPAASSSMPAVAQPSTTKSTTARVVFIATTRKGKQSGAPTTKPSNESEPNVFAGAVDEPKADCGGALETLEKPNEPRIEPEKPRLTVSENASELMKAGQPSVGESPANRRLTFIKARPTFFPMRHNPDEFVAIMKQVDKAKEAKSGDWKFVARAIYFGSHVYSTCPQIGFTAASDVGERSRGCPATVDGIRPYNHVRRLRNGVTTSFYPVYKWDIEIGSSICAISLDDVKRQNHDCENMPPLMNIGCSYDKVREVLINSLASVIKDDCTGDICVRYHALAFYLPGTK